MALYILSCIVLILFVLLQPSKSDASGVFGGGATSAAFGPRGTQTVLAKVTIGAAITFFLIAFLFSIPGLFERRSLGEKVGPAESQSSLPVNPTIPTDQTPEGTPPTETQPATDKGSSNPAPSGPEGGAKSGSKDSKK
jgi:protein translocase SecG subunit